MSTGTNNPQPPMWQVYCSVSLLDHVYIPDFLKFLWLDSSHSFASFFSSLRTLYVYLYIYTKVMTIVWKLLFRSFPYRSYISYVDYTSCVFYHFIVIRNGILAFWLLLMKRNAIYSGRFAKLFTFAKLSYWFHCVISEFWLALSGSKPLWKAFYEWPQSVG